MPGDISFEQAGWSLLAAPPPECESGWISHQGFVIVLQHFGVDRGLRERMHDLTGVRNHYRSGFAKEGMGLVQCDILKLDGIPAVCALGKLVTSPEGATYAGTIAIPLRQESYVFNMATEEHGITGIRETAVMMKTMAELEKQGYALEMPPPTSDQQSGTKAPIVWKDSATGEVIRWARDPYDPGFDGPCLWNLADGPEHDVGFPEHPLSQVRSALKSLVQGVRLSARLKRRAVGKNRWLPW